MATTGRRSPHVSSRTTGTGLFEKCAQHIRTTLRDAFPELRPSPRTVPAGPSLADFRD
ncbi:hypothetical protein [Streptomyces sp. NPDC045369]|uniref:hypothetical protein n=1 Tax=Streptomyces sp. NPDC045369 TaxID=3155732 RepID=UPI0033F80FCB